MLPSFFLLLSVSVAFANANQPQELLGLAEKRFGVDWLSKEESMFLQNLELGELTDFTTNKVNRGGPTNWQAKVRADLLIWVVGYRKASDLVSRRGIRLKGADIVPTEDGRPLNLISADIRFPFNCVLCRFGSGVDFQGAKLEQLYMEKCTLTNQTIDLRGATIARGLTLTDCDIMFVQLDGAKIASSVSLMTSRIQSVRADGVIIGRSMLLNDASVTNEVSLVGSNIGVDIYCSGLNAGRIEGKRIKVGGTLDLGESTNGLRRGFKVGPVNLRGGKIGSELLIRKGEFTSTLDISFLHVFIFDDKVHTWPAKSELKMQGFHYDYLDDGDNEASTRLSWLFLQDELYPDSFARLARVQEESGAKRASYQTWAAFERQTAPVLWRWFGRLIDYGYKPWRAVWISLGLVLIGGVIFALFQGSIVPLKEREFQYCTDYPKFSPLLYSLDLFVPLIVLHQCDYWTASGPLKLYQTGHILMGWILTTLFVVGVTGLVKAS